MSFFRNLFESKEARAKRLAEERKKNVEEMKRAFLLMVAVADGMQGNIPETMKLIEQRFPERVKQSLTLLGLETVRLAVSGMDSREQLTRIKAMSIQLADALAAELKK